MPPTGMGPLNSLLKRKTTNKVNCPPKKPKVVIGSTVRETPLTTQLPFPPCLGKRKGLMTDHGPVSEKRIILLYEDLKYAIGQLLSIIKADDYEDLGNHATEAIREMGLFNLAQVCIRLSFFLIALLSLFLMMF